MSHLIPQARADRNGKVVTRHVKPDVATDNARVAPSPTSSSAVAPEYSQIAPNLNVSELDEKGQSVHMSLRFFLESTDRFLDSFAENMRERMNADSKKEWFDWGNLQDAVTIAATQNNVARIKQNLNKVESAEDFDSLIENIKYTANDNIKRFARNGGSSRSTSETSNLVAAEEAAFWARILERVDF